jgi:hypothetical protein
MKKPVVDLMQNFFLIEGCISPPAGAARKTRIFPRALPGLCHFTHSVGEFLRSVA